ncbi:signal peptidase II [Pseudomonadota bacterium]
MEKKTNGERKVAGFYTWAGIAVILVLTLDYVSKYFVIKYVPEIEFLPFASLTYTENVGAAWSLAIDPRLLVILSFIILIFVNHFYLRDLNLDKTMTRVSYGLIVGGALGNMIDRMMFGHVVDYISIGWWPVFNLADTFIVIGIFLLILFYGKIKRV